MITHEELVNLLDYFPETGKFVWKNVLHSKNQIKTGDIAGCVNFHGYRYICIHGRRYRANRLAWFYVNKRWPEKQIDHINLIRDDDRISNLREATNQQNQWNRKKKSSSSMRLKGVTKDKYGKFIASIRVNKKLIYLGYFSSEEEAHAAYCKAADEFANEFSNHG